MCIQKPAETMHLSGQIDTLKEKTIADICIMEKKEKEICFYDKYGGTLKGERMLIPRLTIKNGKIVYRNIEF